MSDAHPQAVLGSVSILRGAGCQVYREQGKGYLARVDRPRFHRTPARRGSAAPELSITAYRPFHPRGIVALHALWNGLHVCQRPEEAARCRASRARPAAGRAMPAAQPSRPSLGTTS